MVFTLRSHAGRIDDYSMVMPSSSSSSGAPTVYRAGRLGLSQYTAGLSQSHLPLVLQLVRRRVI